MTRALPARAMLTLVLACAATTLPHTHAQTYATLGCAREVWRPTLSFSRPVFVGHAGDGSGRVFVAEQVGRIWAVDRAGARTLFADITTRTSRDDNEEGLLGLAFHPKFAANGRVFLHYSSSRTPHRTGVIAEYRLADGVLDPTTERVVLSQRQPWGNHNGGMIAFGPDGMLYIGFGDGGLANDPLKSGQDLGSWLGKILRVDVDVVPDGAAYGVPKDNPFVALDGARPEIWAYGLRNPWRFSFDRKTGELWAGDVGQNAWEEIDLVVKGGNYGWNGFEGPEPFKGFMGGRGATKGPSPHSPPVAWYPNPAHGRSVTGGYVYRGKAIPALDGIYLYADFVSGRIWTCSKVGPGRYDAVELERSKLSIASFGEDEAGELYLATFEGQIHTLVPRR